MLCPQKTTLPQSEKEAGQKAPGVLVFWTQGLHSGTSPKTWTKSKTPSTKDGIPRLRALLEADVFRAGPSYRPWVSLGHDPEERSSLYNKARLERQGGTSKIKVPVIFLRRARKPCRTPGCSDN
jgi:hypothetical protein